MTTFQYIRAEGTTRAPLSAHRTRVNERLHAGEVALVNQAKNLASEGQVVIEVVPACEAALREWAPDVAIQWAARTFTHVPLRYESEWRVPRSWSRAPLEPGEFLHTEIPDTTGQSRQLVGWYDLSEGAPAVVGALLKQGFKGDIGPTELGRYRAPPPSAGTRIRSEVGALVGVARVVSIAEEHRLLEAFRAEVLDVVECVRLDADGLLARAASLRLHEHENRRDTWLPAAESLLASRLAHLHYRMRDDAAYCTLPCTAPKGSVVQNGSPAGRWRSTYEWFRAERDLLRAYRAESLDHLASHVRAL
jgi:hypothetical protein